MNKDIPPPGPSIYNDAIITTLQPESLKVVDETLMQIADTDYTILNSIDINIAPTTRLLNGVITGIDTVNGVVVENHVSRHLLGGADEIPISDSIPSTVSSTANSLGTSNDVSKANHVHPHGNLSGGSLHEVATTSVAGFMSASDKIKINEMEPSNDLPLSVNTSGSAGTSNFYSRPDHVHSHGNLPGGSLHTVVTTTDAGFMSATDYNKMSKLNYDGTNMTLTTGTISLPAQPFGKYYAVGTSVNASNNTTTTITNFYNTQSSLVDIDYTNNTYTIEVSGVYLIEATLTPNKTSEGEVYGYIDINGDKYGMDYYSSVADPTKFGTLKMYTIVNLSINDQVSIKVFQNTGSSMLITSNNSFFCLKQLYSFISTLSPYTFQSKLLHKENIETTPEYGWFNSLSPDGTILAVGGLGGSSPPFYFVLIFALNGDEWVQQAQIDITNVIGSAYILAVAVSNDTLVIGNSEDNNKTGAIYVYLKNGISWSPQGTKLVGTGASPNTLFGCSVSIDDDTIVVGGYGGVGASWVFFRSGGVWSQQAGPLVGTGAVGNSSQGLEVRVDGDTMAVGGPDDNGGVGAVWVFTRTAGVWSQQGSKLVGVGSLSDAQGLSIGLKGDTILSGTFDILYEFTRTAGVWTQQGSFISIYDKLIGSSVSLSTNNTFVTSSTDGYAYVYKKANNIWTLAYGPFIGNNDISSSSFSPVSISEDGNTFVLSNPFDNSSVGCSYIFNLEETAINFTQQGNKLVGSGNIGNPTQGCSCSIYGDTMAIGGYNDNSGIGAVWIFTRTAGVWTQQGSKLVGTGAVGASQQGFSVSLYEDTLVVGGPQDDSNIGAVWVFTRTAGVWSQQGSKLVGTGAVGASQQGRYVSLYGDTLATGGPFDDSNIGAVWVFTRTAGVWSQQGSKIVGTGSVGTIVYQGNSISVYEDTMAVGGPSDNGNSGATWVFTRTADVWSQQGSKLVGTGAVGSALQGFSVSLYEDTLAVGGYTDNSDAGAVWIFTRTTGVWSQQGSKLVGTGAVGDALQGFNVSLYNNTLAIGGPQDDSEIGAVWIFNRVGGQWTQNGNKLIGAGAVGTARQGFSVSLYNNTLIGGGLDDNSSIGAVWAFVSNENDYTELQSTFDLEGISTSGSGFSACSLYNNTLAISGYLNYYIGSVYVYENGVQTTTLFSPEPVQNTIFGYSVCVYGSTIVVGNPSNAGEVWVFVKYYNEWLVQGPKLIGTGAVGNASQGTSVSIYENTLVSGGSADNGGVGATWVFTRSGGVWSQQGSKLVGTGAVGAAAQGTSVSIYEDTIAIGGTADNSGVGATWIFTRSGGVWTQQGSKLVGTGAVGASQQGFSVSLYNNTLVVGGPEDNGLVGAVWVFTRTAGVWTQQGGKLVGNDYIGAAYQGASVSIYNDTLIFGGQFDNTSQGATWAFTRTAGVWTQQGSKLMGTGAIGNEAQGYSVSLYEDSFYTTSERDRGFRGAAWLFTRTTSVWTQQGSKIIANNSFGLNVEISSVGMYNIYGAIGISTNNSSEGKVWTYIRNGNSWELETTLVGTGSTGNASQGRSVSMYENTLVVGGFSDNGSVGAVWVFTRGGGVWTQQGSKLVGTGATGSSQQGRSVSIYGDTLAIGGSEDNSGVGATWIFTRDGGVWTQQGSKLVGTGAVGASQQGTSVSLYEDTLVVGGPNDNSGAGATWVFTRTAGVWTQQGSKLVGSGASGAASQGTSVSLYDNTLATGGLNDNGLLGATWVFTRSGGVWTQQGSKLVGTGAIGNARQGISVSLYQNQLAVGGSSDNPNTGAVWIFTRTGDAWSQQGSKLVSAGDGNFVGNSVVLYNNTILASNIYKGAVYFSYPPNTYLQNGPKLIQTPQASYQGNSVSLWNTDLAVGSPFYINNIGSTWIFSNNQQEYIGLVGSTNYYNGYQGFSVSLYNNTLAIGGFGDNEYVGAAWLFTQASNVWTQSGTKLVGTGNAGKSMQGYSVSLYQSTLAVGGPADNDYAGAVWIFENGTQQGSKLVGTGAIGAAQQGSSVSVYNNTLVVGGPNNNKGEGAVWVFTRTAGVWSQQGGPLIGVGATNQGVSVSIYEDTLAFGDSTAAWVFTRTAGVWSEQAGPLMGTGGIGSQTGVSVSLYENTLVIGGPSDDGNTGAVWVFTRTSGVWSQYLSKIVGNSSIPPSLMGTSVSAYSNSLAFGGPQDNENTGASWIYQKN